MKTLLLTLSLAVAGVGTAHAQIYSPTVSRGAVIGGIAGALIGGHNHDRWGEGALIGATAGALLGAAVDRPAPYGVVCAPAPVVSYAPVCAPVRVVQVAPPRVVYVNGCGPAYAPYYVTRAPIVVVNRPVVRRHPQTVVYRQTRGWGRD